MATDRNGNTISAADDVMVVGVVRGIVGDELLVQLADGKSVVRVKASDSARPADYFLTSQTSAFGRSLVDDADAAAGRTTLGAQAADADLTALAGVTIATDLALVGTGDGVWGTFPLSAFGRSLVDDETAAEARTTLGLAVKLRAPFHCDGGEACQLGAHPRDDEFLKGLHINMQLADLATCTQVRIFCRVYTNSASANNPRLIARFHTSYTTTVGTFSDLGTSEVSCSLSSYTLANSGWVDLAAAAKIDDCYIAVIQSGGDSSATPRVSSLVMEFR